MFARAISSVEIMRIKIGTIIDEVVDGCHQWKVTRMNSKSSSSTSTIIEYFGIFYLNLDKSWIMNYGSLLRKRKRTSIICVRIFTAYRGISRVRLTRFEQRWYEDESSSVHRETVAFTMRVKPGLFGKQPRQQRRQQQSYVNTFENKVQLQKRKGSFERTELGLWFLDDIRGEDIIWDSHLQECLLRHHNRRHSEEGRATYWDIILLVLRKVCSVQKSPN